MRESKGIPCKLIQIYIIESVIETVLRLNFIILYINRYIHI